MKKLLILLMLFSFNLFSCEKIDNLTQFHINYDINLYVPDSLPVDTLVHLEQSSIAILPEDFEANTTTKDLLEKVELTEVKIKINDSTANFDFLTDIELYIEATDLPKVRIAWSNDIADGIGDELELETLNDNIMDYFKQDKISISADIKADQELSKTIPVNIYFDFLVDAKILGL